MYFSTENVSENNEANLNGQDVDVDHETASLYQRLFTTDLNNTQQI